MRPEASASTSVSRPDNLLRAARASVALLGVAAWFFTQSLTAAATAVATIEALTVLVLRAHYTMDVFTAVLAAAWASSVAVRFAPACDWALARLPFHATRRPHVKTKILHPSAVSLKNDQPSRRGR